jgi:glutathione synthase/RimK-type ligase-like ATP-grasp enzyme
MPQLVQAACQQRDITWQGFSDDWVQRMQRGDTVRWIVGYKFDVNTSAAGHLAEDKVATYAALSAAGVSAIEHYLVRAVPNDPTQWNMHLPITDGPVVIKPLDGTGGRAVERYESVEAGVHAVHHSGEPAWAISPYYDLQTEYRLVMLDGRLLLSLEKTHPTYRGELKLFNLGYGAVAVGITDQAVLQQLTDIATKVMRTMSLRLAAVDIARTAAGDLRVLEVNDGITLEHYLRQSDEYKNRAADVYSAAVEAMFAQG